jgi:acetyl-CoA carboxylase biotin carboxyl carrier protein
MNLTHDDVQEIIRLLDTSAFDEIQIETGRFKLTLRRGGADGWTQETRTSGPDTTASATPAHAQPAAEAALEPGVAAVRAPLVGTFYRAPKPGAEPFVEAGASVSEETVVAIIETMKLMNSVHAGVHGTVIEICAGNAEFVEHGRMLMKVRTAAP